MGYSTGTLRAFLGRSGLVVFTTPPTAAQGARAFGVFAIGRGSRVLAAGVTWTSRTSNAQWAARGAHTSVIDAAGAIYVIGGNGNSYSNGDTYFNDVWASADGGARLDSRWGG
jgi:hypothetical protein